MAKAVGCARKICRAELEEVPPNAMAGNVMAEMPSAVARVGTVNVPTYFDGESRGMRPEDLEGGTRRGSAERDGGQRCG